MLSINVRSLTDDKLTELAACALDQDVQVILVQESWLDEHRSGLSIPGFTMLRNDRACENGVQRGGGTAVYYRSHLKVAADKRCSVHARGSQYEHWFFESN
jgi:hypothetical protein